MAATGQVKAWRSLLENNPVLPLAWDRQSGPPPDSAPFAISINSIEGLRRPEVANVENIEYQLRTTFFDVTYKQFFGRTWAGKPKSGKGPSGNPLRVVYNQNVYFHTALSDASILVVVELVAVSHLGGGHTNQLSCGWGFFRPFMQDVKMSDLSSTSTNSDNRLDFYHGSPRALLYLDEPLEHCRILSQVSGCHVLFSIHTHRHLKRVMHLIPENVFVGANDTIPGLADAPRDDKVKDPLRKPRQVKAMPCYLEKLVLSLAPTTEKVEEEMCRLLNEDHINRENKVADGTSVSIKERRLQIGVHNGWCYIDKVEVIHLSGDTGSSKGMLRRGSIRGHQRTPSTGSQGSVVGSLFHRNRVQLDGMGEDQNLVVVFILEYILDEPIIDNKPLCMTKSSTFTVALRLAVWNPFLQLDQEKLSVQLHGGPAPVPDSVLLFSGSTETAVGTTVASVSTPGSCGTINFEFSLLRKDKSSSELLLIPSGPDVSMLNLPLSTRTASQGSLNDMAELQQLRVPGRPPIPASKRTSAGPDLPNSNSLSQSSIQLQDSQTSVLSKSKTRSPKSTGSLQSLLEVPVVPPNHPPVVPPRKCPSSEPDSQSSNQPQNTQTSTLSMSSPRSPNSMGSLQSLLEVPVEPPNRPPVVPPRGAAGLGTSGYQMSLSPGFEMPLSQSGYAAHQMAPPGVQAYRSGAPYAGFGPLPSAPEFHSSPRGYIPVEITQFRDSTLPMDTARTEGVLQELPYTPVHAPIMVTVPGRNTGHCLSRAAYAKLYTAGFPPILDSRGEPPEVVDPSVSPNFDLALEETDKLQANEIIFQFLAYSRSAIVREWSCGQKPATIFFTFQFYRFPQVTTERLLLGTVESDLSVDPQALPCLLQKLGKDGAVVKGPPGFQVKYHVDPAFLKPCEGRRFIEHMSQQTLFIDVWDGDSLMLIGSCAVNLKNLCRQGREAVQVTYELDVVATEYLETVPAGDVMRDGAPCTLEVHEVLKGRLHLRLADIGYLADSKYMRTDCGSFRAKTKKVISPESGLDSHYGGGSLITPPSGDHASVLRKTRVAKAAHMTEVDHELAAVLFTRQDKMSESGSLQTSMSQQRRLARMAAVRQKENEGPHMISSYRAEKEERSRDLKTIDLYRSQSKREGILNMLNSAITSEYTINPSLGTTEFFEFVLRNPYNVQHTIIIDVDDPELRVVTDSREWRHYKLVNDINTPVEDGLFNMNTQSTHPEVFLRPKECVSIPFAFLSLKADQSVQPQAPTNPFTSAPNTRSPPQQLKQPHPLDSRLIRIYFKTQANRPVAILSLKVDPQPHVIDQTFRFHHPEQSFLKKSVRLPPLHMLPGMPIGGSVVNQVFVRCSDPNVITDSRLVQQGEPHDINIKVACGPSPQVKRFFLVLYTDPHLSAPLQIWQVYVHALQRVDVAATEGQLSRFTLMLRGTQASRLVQCFSSHADEMQIEPRDPFMLAGNALQEVQIGVRPRLAGTKFFYINIVDVEYHQMVRTWLVCVTCQAPLITKAYELTLPVGGGKGSNKRIAYTNPYPQQKTFTVKSNRDDLLQFKETRLEMGPGETASLGLRFAPTMAPGCAEILVFINNEEDKNEETFSVRATYRI